MKFLKCSLVVFLVFVSVFVLGCEKKSFSQPILFRDNYNTGGNLTFYYDEQSCIAYFGEEGEVVQFYQEDIAKGWTEKGCRVGVSLLLPTGLKDYKSATVQINGEEYNSNDFIIQIDNQTTIAQFQPIVSKDNRVINLKIKWEEGSHPQEYKIVIKQGAIFMTEN